MTLPLTLDQLVREEELFFKPLSGAYDTAAITTALAGMAPGFEDPARPGLLVLTDDEASRNRFLARSRTDPAEPPPLTLLVQLRPDVVTVMPVDSEGSAHVSRQVVAWMFALAPCRVTNGRGTEVSLASTT
jgi:hypothetical protein